MQALLPHARESAEREGGEQVAKEVISYSLAVCDVAAFRRGEAGGGVSHTSTSPQARVMSEFAS